MIKYKVVEKVKNLHSYNISIDETDEYIEEHIINETIFDTKKEAQAYIEKESSKYFNCQECQWNLSIDRIKIKECYNPNTDNEFCKDALEDEIYYEIISIKF